LAAETKAVAPDDLATIASVFASAGLSAIFEANIECRDASKALTAAIDVVTCLTCGASSSAFDHTDAGLSDGAGTFFTFGAAYGLTCAANADKTLDHWNTSAGCFAIAAIPTGADAEHRHTSATCLTCAVGIAGLDAKIAAERIGHTLQPLIADIVFLARGSSIAR
jgi:hypothetical protein